MFSDKVVSQNYNLLCINKGATNTQQIRNASNPTELTTSIFLSCASTDTFLLFSHDPTADRFLYALLNNPNAELYYNQSEKAHCVTRFQVLTSTTNFFDLAMTSNLHSITTYEPTINLENGEVSTIICVTSLYKAYVLKNCSMSNITHCYFYQH